MKIEEETLVSINKMAAFLRKQPDHLVNIAWGNMPGEISPLPMPLTEATEQKVWEVGNVRFDQDIT